ncbi:Na+/H+ antiporter subunit G1 [Staphylococcus gallinarum]|jgi:multicomponent Na+:H+ antiporter subunit G|uniref:Na+/H+ antiporter subunit G1 n=1 Tax=Staphylococcus gallinarum TaxID=1293 RepID=A0A2T4SVD2_STAGA|nr:Na+/H+ antiporter subunit G1 [Staphylococcus gallinarum]MCD8821096.1 Na+/H+ antiporter subunit G1 [Staphylococcus gallinarum]MCD8825316.1 Na+/H+ antiporter subunit G1 [Staphylococcus gallinarum]MCD8872222.1 Na+/H+ antiporter subunit G1 [Staphylococcus gallinarum]MCW0984454.1 Na+/H+ antiporter subunit G1 [Staphylococcus gallinarum]MEB6242321.1 Na+/H+ antiporter subunit G1 [Staphylococcus gallinarum]
MTETIIISIALILVVLGSIISALAAIGLVRLDDVYARSHAAGKAATLGAMLLLSGVFLFFIGRDGYVNMQLVIGILFILITGPLSSHLIIKAAYNLNTPASKRTKLDDIKEDLKDTKL